MRVTGFLAAAIGVIAGGGLAPAAEAAQGDNVGEVQMCVQVGQIRERRVIDNRTILLRMVVGNAYKRIDLARECPGLKSAGGFASATSISRLCKQDILRVIQEPIGSQCVIDQIVTIDEVEAKKLLTQK